MVCMFHYSYVHMYAYLFPICQGGKPDTGNSSYVSMNVCGSAYEKGYVMLIQKQNIVSAGTVLNSHSLYPIQTHQGRGSGVHESDLVNVQTHVVQLIYPQTQDS